MKPETSTEGAVRAVGGREPAPFSQDHGPTRTEEASLLDELARLGVRLTPFPFASTLAIVSDVDDSERAFYDGYVGELVDHLGLDFGDSTWLQWQQEGYAGPGVGLGLFSRHMNRGLGEASRVFARTRTFLESVAEYHKGNLDHLHAFYGNGPRVAVLESPGRLDEERVVFDLGSFQKSGPWSCAHVFVAGVCVVAKAGRTLDVRAVWIQDIDGGVTEYPPAPFDAATGRQERLFALARSVEDRRSFPKLDRTKAVIIELPGPTTGADIERVLLASTVGPMIIDRLGYLRARFNIELSLITEHSAYHFRNPPRTGDDDRRLAEHVQAYEGPLETYFGSLTDDAGEMVFSTDADHPHSLCRVFPALSTELEARFIVPQAASSETGFAPLRLVSPSPTRAGGGVYWARRALPKVETPSADDPFGDLARHSTFAGRLQAALNRSEQAPGLVWPLYTHLGALPGKRIPDPYFEPGPLLALQDRAFNISGSVPPNARLWFARASVIYDYALMLREIAPHVTRPDANRVEITSWWDSVLGKTLPRSKAQLYGLTFHVDDPAKAEVWLDGEAVETLFRNRPDETGRASVTVAECDIRHILFDRLDPLANHLVETEISNGTWRWTPAEKAERCFGRLACEPGGVTSPTPPASMTIPLHGWTATGAQGMCFDVRSSGETRFALILETRTSGRFQFGDAGFAQAGALQATASYDFAPRHRVTGAWRRLAVPFHDLAWRASAAPGGPLPSHSLESLTILCDGVVDLAAVVFLRPRTVARAKGAPAAYCLGGRIAPFVRGEPVHAQAAAGVDPPRRSVAVDQRGFFCFEVMPAGIYRVWAESQSGILHDRRGPLVEVGADTMTLVLDRPAI